MQPELRPVRQGVQKLDGGRSRCFQRHGGEVEAVAPSRPLKTYRSSFLKLQFPNVARVCHVTVFSWTNTTAISEVERLHTVYHPTRDDRRLFPLWTSLCETKAVGGAACVAQGPGQPICCVFLLQLMPNVKQSGSS